MAEIEDAEFEKIVAKLDAEDNGTQEAPATTEAAEEVVEKKEEVTSGDDKYYAHEEIMKEEGLKSEDLPTEIREMIASFNRQKNIATKKGYGESTYIKIQNLSTLIADKIMDFLEKDIEGEPVVKKEEGGEAEEIEPISDGSEEVIGEEVVVDDNEKKEGGGIFEGVLGGIFNW